MSWYFMMFAVVLLVASMVAVGTAVEVAEVRARLRRPLPLIVALTINLAVIPAVMIYVVSVLPLDDPAKLALVLVAAAPGGGSGALLALQARGEIAQAVAFQTIASVASLFTAPAWIALYSRSAPTEGIDIQQLVFALVVFQFLPLAVGFAIRQAKQPLAERLQFISRRVAEVSLAGLAVVVLVASGEELARLGVATLVGLGIAHVLSLLTGALPIGTAAVRRSTLMTTLVRNLSLAFLAAGLSETAEAISLVIVAYGVSMYLVSFLAIALLPGARSKPSPAHPGGRLRG